MERIYLDHAATTPLRDEAVQAMAPYLGPEFGNPSSPYAEGRRARQAIDVARERLAAALGCSFGEVIFTSSGTEAAQAAILGCALANSNTNRTRVLAGRAEHHCVLAAEAALGRLGYRFEQVNANPDATIDLNDLQSRLGPDVLLVCAMHANNEFGTISDPAPIAEMAHHHGALFFCDIVQSFAHMRIAVGKWIESLGADFLSLSAHKLRGPKGVGALYIRAGTPIKPLIAGGGQEREARAGTENVAGIVGFGVAAQLGTAQAEAFVTRVRESSGAFEAFLAECEDLEFIPTAPYSARLGSHVHGRFPGIAAETMVLVLDQLGMSIGAGAACTSGSLEPSHVMLASGYTPIEAREGVRFSFGEGNSPEQAKVAAERIAEAVEQVRRARK